MYRTYLLDMTYASKSSEMTHLWFTAMPCLIWSFPLHTSWQYYI
ncbi:hypothetical protein ZEAMMB73_Zm00001d000452 [Zea mays]|uniref:Uncharacterized protein n=1 Tax=Zea mays TaxID=4577 RepID=B6UG80_MAIZE|nr:hypothetical protein [Zea mays]ACG48372.1 hypothetical protein [Zea mays]ONM63246.1 hypothetical protein ZEAMMB73_Zm00001d000452 [Zea mays]